MKTKPVSSARSHGPIGSGSLVTALAVVVEGAVQTYFVAFNTSPETFAFLPRAAATWRRKTAEIFASPSIRSIRERFSRKRSTPENENRPDGRNVTGSRKPPGPGLLPPFVLMKRRPT